MSEIQNSTLHCFYHTYWKVKHNKEDHCFRITMTIVLTSPVSWIDLPYQSLRPSMKNHDRKIYLGKFPKIIQQVFAECLLCSKQVFSTKDVSVYKIDIYKYLMLILVPIECIYTNGSRLITERNLYKIEIQNNLKWMVGEVVPYLDTH